MPETNTPPMTPHLVSTAELARYETCRLAWWYDRTHPLAQAAPADIARRLDLFVAVYGPGAKDLPEYHLLTHLRDHGAGASTPSLPSKRAEPVPPLGLPRRWIGCIAALLVLVVLIMIASLVLALVRL